MFLYLRKTWESRKTQGKIFGHKIFGKPHGKIQNVPQNMGKLSAILENACNCCYSHIFQSKKIKLSKKATIQTRKNMQT